MVGGGGGGGLFYRGFVKLTFNDQSRHFSTAVNPQQQQQQQQFLDNIEKNTDTWISMT